MAETGYSARSCCKSSLTFQLDVKCRSTYTHADCYDRTWFARARRRLRAGRKFRRGSSPWWQQKHLAWINNASVRLITRMDVVTAWTTDQTAIGGKGRPDRAFE